ncbi:MAG TPA: signal peptidase I [Polyangiaceae bacterium]|nr:signal peptidase I [Polyangiaceae bacterium]
MKTEEPTGPRKRSSNPVDPSIDSSESHSNGAARMPVDGSAADASVNGAHAAAADELAPLRRSRLLRLLYWALWFVLLPTVLASMAIWILSPAGGGEQTGLFAWAQAVVRSQPVPVGIVLFTVFEVALWAARHQLPFARHAHPPQRADLPARLRSTFERARSLLDEAEMIFAKHEKAIARELAIKERERLRVELDGLRDAMERVPFDETTFIDALARADGEVDVRLGPWRKSEVREYLEAIVMAVAVAFALRAFVIEAFKIPSGSMIPTLMVGDHIFVNKFSYGPAIPYTHTRLWHRMPPSRGDVIVFEFPEHPEQDFIKRVIAVEGDKLEARNGHPIINGWEVPSCRVGPWSYNDYESSVMHHEGDLYVEYLGDESFLTFYDRASGGYPEYQGPYFAKKGEVWVMGDNRNNSHDSRMWFAGQGGGVPFANIKGRALFVWLSVSDSGIDWSREGAPVMGRPRLPPSAAALESQLDQCLKKRPAVTMPPDVVSATGVLR